MWGTGRPLFKAEITHNGVGLDINVTAPVVAETEVVNINEAVEWLSEQWDIYARRKVLNQRPI